MHGAASGDFGKAHRNQVQSIPEFNEVAQGYHGSS